MREARDGDLEQLLALYRELMDGDRPEALPGAVASSTAAMRAILADPARHLLVGTVAEDVLGTVDMLIAPNLTHHSEPWAVVENVSSHSEPGAAASDVR